MSIGNTDTEKPENLRTVYKELCNSYRAIDDFRTKLLGFLPLATGAGIFFLVTDKAKIDFVRPYFGPIGLFGFFITLGLSCYELYGIRKCTCLIWAGKKLERELNISNGQFLQRPNGVAGFINEPFAAGVIYPAVLAAWTFIGLAFSRFADFAPWAATGVFIIGLSFAISYNQKMASEGKNDDAACNS